MMCLILCESLPHPLESCKWDENNVCSYVVKYVCVGSLNLDTWLRLMNAFIRVAIFDV